MINRTITLRLMFVALAATALLGVSAVLARDEDILWQMFGTSVSVAVACGLLACWSLLGLLRAFRSSAYLLSIVTLVNLLLVNAMVWEDQLGLDVFELLVSLAVIDYMLPAAVIGLVLSEFDWGTRAGWTGFGATTAATLLICTEVWFSFSGEMLAVAGAATGTAGWLAALVLLQPHGQPQARLEWRKWAGLSFAGAFGMLWIVINMTWHLRTGWEPGPLLMDVATALGTLAIATAISELLQSLAMPSKAVWLRRSVIVLAWATLLVIASQVIRETHNQRVATYDFMFRLSMSMGIVTLCGIVSCLCLTAISTALRRGRTGSGLLRFNCPVCNARQTMASGKHACPHCQSMIHFDYEVTRCQACRYPRTGWTSDSCPECGWLIGTQPSTPG